MWRDCLLHLPRETLSWQVSPRRRLIPGMAPHQGVVGGLTPSCGEGITPHCGLIYLWQECIHSVHCTDVQGSFRRHLIPGMAQHQGVVGGLTPSCGEGVTPDCGLGASFSEVHAFSCCWNGFADMFEVVKHPFFVLVLPDYIIVLAFILWHISVAVPSKVLIC